MKTRTAEFIDLFFERRRDLASLRETITGVCEKIKNTFKRGGKLLLCGNGGSAADCDHIAGELLKGFMLKRPLSGELKKRLALFGAEGARMSEELQQGLPAISLCSHSAAISAFANDVDPAFVYAQEVIAYGREGDTLIGISTSGNAENVTAAVTAARALGIFTVAFSGRDGGRLCRLADAALIIPQSETYRIQEDHIAIYHLICTVVEYEMFDV